MTRVLLAEDHALVRSGIRSLLEASKEVEVVGEAGNGREAIDLAIQLKPDLVLMDLAMNELNGIDATRQLSAQQAGTQVIILSMHGDEQYIYESLKAGAKGYVLKSSAFKELITGIHEVCAGRTYVSPSLAGIVVNDYVRRAKGSKAPGELDKLTTREREVLQLIAEGNSSAEVAQRLYISVRTVDTHRHNIMEKLKIHSIAGLTKFAIRNGLCQLQ
jgi:two-component system, NarL family, response regulator NreC